MRKILKNIVLTFIFLIATCLTATATDFTEQSFLIAEGNASNLNSPQFWSFFQNNRSSGLEIKVAEDNNSVVVKQNGQDFNLLLNQFHKLLKQDSTKILPVFLTFKGDISVLDSIIKNSPLSSYIFYLPQGEAWPSVEYLIQANRRLIFFVKGKYENDSRIMHELDNYALQIAANEIAGSPDNFKRSKAVSLELLVVNDFDKLPTEIPPNRLSRNLVPDYINFLLETWTSYGKRPNFIFVGRNIFNFDFIIEQLKSFAWINGVVKVAEKTMEKVYWRNPDVTVTGGKFSFPYRGGEEITLSPFVPGYRMTPEQIIVTGEMDIPEQYTIIAAPMQLNTDLTGSFNFEGIILNNAKPAMVFRGENFAFTEDIERGKVLRLPENASVNLGAPEAFGLRNSSFTVSCFVKFTEIMEYGDNAVLGNYEQGYRRGLHLILRSGHPYFGLWSNDFVSDVTLQPNNWYHLVWRYILETGEQAIFLNGRNIGSSDGHPPFSGTGDIHLGSALSQGASLRGYIDDLYIWSRPIGNEEITRLALDEQLTVDRKSTAGNFFSQIWVQVTAILLLIIVLIGVVVLLAKKIRSKKPAPVIALPKSDTENQIQLFDKFKAIDKDGNDITVRFTPKIKELFLYILLYTLKNGTGAQINEVDENLWPGQSPEKAANNRAVTLNKLRRVLSRINGIEVITQNSHLQAKEEEPFFCDYAEAFKLCQVPGGMHREQLETFYLLVKKGRFLRGANWTWLDEMRGYTGNQVLDNLLKLASEYKNENRLQEVDTIAKRILEYDDLNEEAIYLQIWTLQKNNNVHMAKFNFNSFKTKYREMLGEEFTMSFEEFTQQYSRVV